MCYSYCFFDINWQTIWTAVGVIATIVGIILGAKQWQSQIFLKLDDIFTEDDFRAARSNILNYLWDNKRIEWHNIATPEDLEEAIEGVNAERNKEKEDIIILKNDITTVCRKMNKVCYPQLLYPKSKVFMDWGRPIGKCWGLLQDCVQYAREKDDWNKPGQEKWKEFENTGAICFDKLDLTEQQKENIENKADIIKAYFISQKT